VPLSGEDDRDDCLDNCGVDDWVLMSGEDDCDDCLDDTGVLGCKPVCSLP